MKDQYTFADLCDILEVLLGENGCPWDKAQTHESLLPNLLEETYEVIDATNRTNMNDLCEELGDVLLQVALHSKIAEKEHAFTVEDVTTAISRKMIRRHPHVFPEAAGLTNEDSPKDPQGQSVRWEQIKTNEKGFKSHSEALRSVPATLPALMRAEKVLKRAAKSKLNNLPMPLFESPVKGLEHLIRQAEQLKERLNNGFTQDDEQVGELFLLIVTISANLQTNAEFALTNAVERFINRFEDMENSCDDGVFGK